MIFDLDGTLVQSSTSVLLPNVPAFFDLTLRGKCPDAPGIAVATNQGGVGIRYWMQSDHFGKPKHYPTEEMIEARLAELRSLLNTGQDLPMFASYRYQDKQGRWSPVPPGHEDDPRWSPEWRKPAPGMLSAAMRSLNVSPAETLFVGDRGEDQAAAQAAGCAFAWAKDFFARPWQTCADLAQLHLWGIEHFKSEGT